MKMGRFESFISHSECLLHTAYATASLPSRHDIHAVSLRRYTILATDDGP